MDPKFTAPQRTTKESNDRNLSKENLKKSDFVELDAIIDEKKNEKIFNGQVISTIPYAGYDGWYPTEEEINKFLEDHKPLLKKDIVFLRSLKKIDKFSVFYKNMMNESQKKAYEIICKLDI